jgi:hypothetical protein
MTGGLIERARAGDERAFRLMVEPYANGQPAFGSYTRDAQTGIFHASDVVVLTLAGGQ